MAKAKRHKSGLVIRRLPNFVPQRPGKPDYDVYVGARKRRPKQGKMVLKTG